MKKILCLILSLVCVFMLFSCAGAELTNEEKFIQIVNSKSPTKITTLYYYTLASGETVNAKYVTEIEGENFIFEYTKGSFNDLGAGSDTAADHGFVYYKDGKYSTDGETWFAEAPAYDSIDIKFNLDASNFIEYELSADLTELYAVLDAAGAKAVLGLDISADGDIEMTVVNNGTYLTNVSISYKTVSGATVQLDTSYTYNVVSLYD